MSDNFVLKGGSFPTFTAFQLPFLPVVLPDVTGNVDHRSSGGEAATIYSKTRQHTVAQHDSGSALTGST